MKSSSRGSSVDVVDRFLVDAERAAREGDRAVALDLLLLALDTAPGDSSVLVRAQMVRNHLPLATGSALAQSSEPIQVPDFPDVLEVEKLPAALAAVSQRPRTGLVVGVGVGGSSPPESWPSPRPVQERGLGQAPRAKTSAAPAFLRPLLAGMVAVSLLLALVVYNRPLLLTEVQRMYASRFDPLNKAERSYQEGDLEEALLGAQTVQESAEGKRAARAALLIGKIQVQQGKLKVAKVSLLQAAKADPQWEIALEAGGLLMGARDTTLAAQAYRAAFEKGAPPEHWRTIMQIQQAAGNESFAQQVKTLLERVERETAVPASSSGQPGGRTPAPGP